ncbi:MAG: hypothetical protein MJ240_04520 [Kiritimatiellae bacterium]|nr:hypothetical protein [Kiritimatiellia bacterium]
MKAYSILFAAVLGFGHSLCAGNWVDGTWTGAEDGFFTNANNWASGQVPGRYLVPDAGQAGGFATNGVKGATVIFGDDLTGNAVTTIDFDGVYSMTNLIVTAKTHRYTFGTAPDQYVPIECRGTFNGGATPDALTPTIACRVRVGVECDTTGYGSDYHFFRNDSTEELVIGDFGYITNPKAADGKATGNEFGFRLYGRGPIRFTKMRTSCGSGNSHINHYMTGTLYLDARFPFRNYTLYNETSADNGKVRHIVIGEKGYFENAAGFYAALAPNANVPVEISGPGVFRQSGGGNAGSSYNPHVKSGMIQVTAPITVSSKMELTMTYPAGYESFVPGLWITGGGLTLTLNCPEDGNTIKGLFRFTSSVADATLAVPRIGMRGTYGAHGDEDFSFINNGRLLYTGPGETMDRAICITNQLAQGKDTASTTQYPASGTLEQGGTGDLRVESAVTLSGPKAGTFTLANNVAADGIFAGSVEGGITMVKSGTGRWKYAVPLAYTGSTRVLGGTLFICKGASFAASSDVSLAAGAELVFEGDPEDPISATCPPISPTSGNATVRVGAGCTLTLSALVNGGGILNVVTEDATARVKLAGQGSGDAPSFVAFNGSPAAFDAGGNLKKQTVSVTTTVPVRGGVVPNDAAAGVGIVDGGTSGNITLAADEVHVKSLVQQASAPATVALGANQVLEAEKLAVDEGRADLTIGADNGGLLRVSASTLTAWPESADATITVNARADLSAASELNLNGAGTVRFNGGLDFTGAATLHGGELAVTPSGATQNFSLLGTGVFAKEGDGDLVVAKASPSFLGDYVVRGGSVQPGAADASKLFGATGDLVLTNGAALRVFGNNNTVTYGEKRLHLYDGARVEIDRDVALTTAPFRQMRLDGDATVIGTVLKSGKDFNLVGQKDGVRGQVDLAGHTLVKDGYGRLGFNLVDFISGGTLLFAETPGFTGPGAGNLLILGGSLSLPEDETVQLVASNGTTVCFSNVSTPVQIPWEVHGTNYLGTWTQGRQATNYNNWAGPINLVGADSQLALYPYNDSLRQLVVSGRISGEGAVRLQSTSGAAGRIFLAAPENDFTGTMDFIFPGGSGSYGQVAFARSTTIPDFSKLSLRYYGAACLRLSADGTAWPIPEVGRLLREATFRDSAFVGLDLDDVGDYTMNLSELGAAPTETSGFGRHGFYADDYTLTVNVDTDWVAPKLMLGGYNGRLLLKGDAGHYLRVGGMRISGDCDKSTGRVDIVNTELRVENVTIGAHDRATAFLRVGPGSVLSGASGMGTSAYVGLGNCTSAHGTLDLDDGMMQATLAVGAGANSYGGAIYQHSGSFIANGTCYLGSQASGYWQLDGGTALFVGQGRLSCATATNTTALIVMNGGTMTFNGENTPILAGGQKMGHSHFLLKGGRMLFESTGVNASMRAMELPWSGISGYDSTAVVTLDGAEALFAVTNTQNIFLANQTNGLAILNLNAGVMAVGEISACVSRYPGSAAYLNFNGGTLRATRDTTDWAHGLTRVEVGEKGAVIDTAGFDATFAQSLVKPTGQGVVAVPWPADEAGLNAPVEHPYFVRILGDGSGASAVVEYDRATKRMTGIRVLSAGSGYTWAKVYVTSGQSTINNHGFKTELLCTLGAAPVSGGLVKKGAGTLTLTGVNTWEGNVVVEEGLLKLGVEGALPEGSAVTLKGGGLAVAAGVAMPASLDVELTAAQLADKKARYTLVSYPEALPETLPSLNYTQEIPTGAWTVCREGNALVLRRLSGTSIYFR